MYRHPVRARMAAHPRDYRALFRAAPDPVDALRGSSRSWSIATCP
jgi:hypothetical protein